MTMAAEATERLVKVKEEKAPLLSNMAARMAANGIKNSRIGCLNSPSKEAMIAALRSDGVLRNRDATSDEDFLWRGSMNEIGESSLGEGKSARHVILQAPTGRAGP